MKFLAHGNSRSGARGSGPGHGVSGGSRGVNADAGRQRTHIFGKIAKPGIHNPVWGKGMRAASRAAGGAVLMQLRLIKPGSHGGSGGAFSDAAQPAGGRGAFGLAQADARRETGVRGDGVGGLLADSQRETSRGGTGAARSRRRRCDVWPTLSTDAVPGAACGDVRSVRAVEESRKVLCGRASSQEN